jgi:hypothetical protein
MTSPLNASGCAQIFPDSPGTLHAGAKGSAEPLLWSTPLSALSPW